MGDSSRRDGAISITRVLTDGEIREKQERANDATTGASAAGARALAARAVAFYFRAPAKAFFRMRVDYLAAARAINPRIQAQEGWSLATSTPGLLAHAVREHGWRFLPNQVLPPMAANVAIGAVLYTSYLQILGALHEGSGGSRKRVYPPPTLGQTFTAGFAAGGISSLVAAPFDALQVRFDTNEMLGGKYRSVLHYGQSKLKEIGLRGVLAGWSLSFAKDTVGYGLFFATFEYIKSQAFYSFVTRYYGKIRSPDDLESYRQGPVAANGRPTIRPHWSIEPCFLLAAGMSATFAQQAVQYPLTNLQNMHYARLETLDRELLAKEHQGTRDALRTYRRAYAQTFQLFARESAQAGGRLRWLYRGFALNTIRQVPSTSAGLIIFEMFRRRYANSQDEIRIQKDGFDVLLS